MKDHSPAAALDAQQLKLIALITMTIDHLGYYGLVSPSLVPLCRTIGRISAPLFLFLVTESMRFTRSRECYLLRLFLAGSLIGLSVHLLDSWELLLAPVGNILPTFFYTALIIYVLQLAGREHRWTALLFLLGLWGSLSLWALAAPALGPLRILLPAPNDVMYSFSFVILGVLWYCCPRRTTQMGLLAFFALAGLIPGLADGLDSLIRPLAPFFSARLFQPFQLPMLLALPFLWYYNGERGKRGSPLFFYLYYPLHQLLFPGLGILLGLTASAGSPA